MLIQLEIRNFAIIEHSLIDFKNGFNVISGETGAGKSIILDALGAILGERTSKSSIRKGEEKATIKAVFLKTPKLEKTLKEKNIYIADDYLIIERQILASGRSVVKINESIKTTQIIKEICVELVEICGQKDHLELLKEEKYLQMIDKMGSPEHEKALVLFKETYTKWQETAKSLQNLLSNERQNEQLLDLYRFQKQEIDAMELTLGEDEELQDERKFLASYEKISTAVSQSLFALEAVDNVYSAKDSLSQASKYDEKLLDFVERLDKSYIELSDIKSDIAHYIDSVEYDEQRLNEIMYRLDQINTLKRKYADSIEGILSFRDDIDSKLYDIDNKEEKIAELKANLTSLEKVLAAQSKELHRTRLLICQTQQTLVNNKLKELCMPDAVFEFQCTVSDQYTHTGNTKISILFNANKGEDLKPLAKIASGGELSRVLLALKIIQNSKEVHTLIFDEVDEGIGGEVGWVIGERLKELGQQVQVIAISHLPQVAARAHHHFLISKKTENERTVSRVDQLSDQQRIKEVARMIYGDQMNDITLKQAEEMITR